MIFNYTSIGLVIGKVFRDTGVTSSDVESDMQEWIPEALEQMQVQLPAGPGRHTVVTDFHAAKLPCGILYIKAVEYMGKRLRLRNTDNDVRGVGRIKRPQNSNIWVTNPNTYRETVTHNQVIEPTLQLLLQSPWVEDEYYQISGGAIWTSMPAARITLHTEEVPTDDTGFPLVPDNAALREALYYYTRAKMVGSGKLKDTVFNEETLMMRYESFAARAIEQITYPTPEEMQMMANTLNRLVKSEQYYGQFGNPGEAEQYYGTYGTY